MNNDIRILITKKTEKKVAESHARYLEARKKFEDTIIEIFRYL